MQLLYTKRSPYARKVRVVAMEKSIELDMVDEDLSKKSDRLLKANPLGKIPALVLDNGEALFDSPVICAYLDSLNNSPVLIPAKGAARFAALRLEAIGDGMMDTAVALYLEKNRHPNDFNPQFIANQEETIRRTLDYCNRHADVLKPVNVGTIAVACAIGYVQFRLAHLFDRNRYQTLAAWLDEFNKKPSMGSTQPA